ncbi:MAG: peptidase [Planctomycetota bacterium]|nr:MAG: peptidase [Planctomycetota bacterium]
MKSSKGYYTQPTVHGERIVFVCEGDLWLVSTEGGTATRLHATPGTANFPRFSPDGRRIAFTGRDDGPAEVFVMDADGGVPERRTWLGAPLTRVVGWTSDGKSILFSSDSARPFMKWMELYQVAAAGGLVQALHHGPASTLSLAAKGKGRVIGRNSSDPARWKRYRGGTAGKIWIDKTGRNNFVEMLQLPGNLADPMWIGDRIWFLSDHEGHGNLYSCKPSGEDLRQETKHKDFYLRYPSTDGKSIVYHAGADIWILDIASGETRRVDIHVPSARSERAARYVPAQRWFESLDLNPDGAHLASIHRGGLFTMGLWEGPVRRHGKASAERFRLATWLSDGKRLVATNDGGGDEQLIVFDTATGVKKTLRGDFGRPLSLAVAPKSKGSKKELVAVINQRQELYIVDVLTGRRKQIAHSPHSRFMGMDWSHDGRFLAYAIAPEPNASCIEIFDTKNGKTQRVTRPEFSDAVPCFDPEGRYLYFLSGRVFDPVFEAHHFNYAFPKGYKPYALPLRRDLPSPFAKEQRPVKTLEGQLPGAKPDSKKGEPKFEIDFDGIEDRIVEFPVPEGRFLSIAATQGRVLFLRQAVLGTLSRKPGSPEDMASAKLEAWDFDKDKLETIQDKVSGIGLDLHKKLLAIVCGKRVRVINAKGKPAPNSDKLPAGRESGWIDWNRIRLLVEPGAEWRQMFLEAWRLQREQFWDGDMSGIDWEAVRDDYLPLVDRVATRAEFSDLMWEMQGELGTSHAYEMAGDYAPRPYWRQGRLGAELAPSARGNSWRIDRIPHGDSWIAKASSPLAAPGLQLAKGDEILSIGGQDLTRDEDPHKHLMHHAGQAVELSVRSKDARGRRATRKIVVKPMAQEFALYYRDWVEQNRAQVDKASKGKIGYLHLPDMGPQGIAEFERHWRQVNHKEGLIVDVRWNGGGHISQLVLTQLLKRRVGYTKSRWGAPTSYPRETMDGPIVALTNEYAGSDGDIFSHSFKLLGLGPLIGTRTWGGVVGIWPRHALVDGTVTTQPEFAFWFDDVAWGVEGHGTDPDIVVDITPQEWGRGEDPQLERAIAEVMKLHRKSSHKPLDFGPLPDRRKPGTGKRKAATKKRSSKKSRKKKARKKRS